MAVFSSRKFTPQSGPTISLNRLFRRNPLLFGAPFIILIVGGSFALQAFTQTRYDLQSQKSQQMTVAEEEQLKPLRRKVDKREEYFRLSAEISSPKLDEWEPKRVPRPAGVPEWGVAPSK